jgi:hypothetical protein
LKFNLPQQVLLAATVHPQDTTEPQPISASGFDLLCSTIKSFEEKLGTTVEATKFSIRLNEKVLVTLIISVKTYLAPKFESLITMCEDYPNFAPWFSRELARTNYYIDLYLNETNQIVGGDVTSFLGALKSDLQKFKAVFAAQANFCADSDPILSDFCYNSYASLASALIESTSDSVKQIIDDTVLSTNEIIFRKASKSIKTVTSLFLQIIFEFESCFEFEPVRGIVENCLYDVSNHFYHQSKVKSIILHVSYILRDCMISNRQKKMCKILWKVTSVCFRICLERNKNC